ncbi:glycoside hydrolase family 172 protein [Novipirellula sp. SH528]|uniref:glycoside hydrolase family 172 protein n=1 Tax=Novipirellula sp. SH528 TaxID=3454466 RepID=UPI003F9FDE90
MISKFTCFFSAVMALSVLVAQAQEPVSIESLLNEMVDRDAVACYPEKDFRLKQHSSYNRASKTPDGPAGWFNNKDNNTSAKDKCFVRIEENNGRKEWVLMEHEGPGAIVRTWMPWRGHSNASTDVNMRIYLDGADEPVLEGNMLSMFDGRGVIPYPFAHPSLRSAVSFFPIPYAKSCKVTTDQMPFFFQVTFRAYNEGTPIKTFAMEDFEAAKGLTEKTGRLLLDPGSESHQESGASVGPKVLTTSATVESQAEQSLDLPAGTASVQELSVKLGSYKDPNVTRQLVLKMEFDGKETVWCPIGDFFGSGIGLNPVQGWSSTVAEDGTMTCRWVMPYQNSGKVSLLNLSGAPVDAELVVKTGDWNWDDRSMYFHAGWRGQYPVPTRPYSDWNYVTLKGRGVYVADTLTVMNPVEKWWGEGDEKIWVDGEDFPSIFGTGTEDYYAYSWGGVSTDFYEHPFHAQPRAHEYNKLNRKPKDKAGVRNTLGYSVETRSRSLDTMPFASSLQLDMEVWSWTDCEMAYGVGMCWYGFADTTSNRKPEPAEVLNVPPVPDLQNATPESSADSFKDAVEIDPERVRPKPNRIVLKMQDLKKLKFKGTWNQGTHQLFKGADVGDVVELDIPAASDGAEKLTLYATKSRDFGILRFSVNGKPAGAKVDLYAAKPVPTGAIELGDFEPIDSAYVVRVEVVGKNPKSQGAFFGLDCITLSSPTIENSEANQ